MGLNPSLGHLVSVLSKHRDKLGTLPFLFSYLDIEFLRLIGWVVWVDCWVLECDMLMSMSWFRTSIVYQNLFQKQRIKKSKPFLVYLLSRFSSLGVTKPVLTFTDCRGCPVHQITSSHFWSSISQLPWGSLSNSSTFSTTHSVYISKMYLLLKSEQYMTNSRQN